MAKPKCAHCKQKIAKRHCPALDARICPTCCGRNRLETIDCPPDCVYLGNVAYQKQMEKEKGVYGLLSDVPSKEDDIFHDKDAAKIAYRFESFYADCFRQGKFRLHDIKVREALVDLYYAKYQGGEVEPDAFTAELFHCHDRIKAEFPNDEELIGQVILRLILSTKRMSGGALGNHSYLTYLRDNLPVH